MLVLVQHGEAMAKEEDPERPLTTRGEADVERLGHVLRAAGVEIDDLFDSGKLRARQTAEILARQLAPERGAEEKPGLGATDPVEPIAAEIEQVTRSLMLVGHQPFLGQLTAVLLQGNEAAPPAAFTPGSAVALQRAEGGWQMAWMLTPELLAAGRT